MARLYKTSYIVYIHIPGVTYQMAISDLIT